MHWLASFRHTNVISTACKLYKRNNHFYQKCLFGFCKASKHQLQFNDVIDCLAMTVRRRPESVLFTHGEMLINDCNAALLLANQANDDIQYIGHLGSRLLYYITDYLTKHEGSEYDDVGHDVHFQRQSFLLVRPLCWK